MPKQGPTVSVDHLAAPVLFHPPSISVSISVSIKLYQTHNLPDLVHLELIRLDAHETNRKDEDGARRQLVQVNDCTKEGLSEFRSACQR